MQVRAEHRYLRASAQKVRLVLPAVRGRNAEEAVAYLRLMPQAAAKPVAKVISSALANAEHNYSLDPKHLIVARASADEGPSMKRFKPAARGRAAALKRRSTHVTIILDEAPHQDRSRTKAVVAKAAAAPKAAVSTAKRVVTKKKVATTKVAPKTTTKKPATKAAAVSSRKKVAKSATTSTTSKQRSSKKEAK
jgi:large subunit ribosomal protein L22